MLQESIINNIHLIIHLIITITMDLHIFSYDNDWNNTIKDIVDHNYFINLLFHQRIHTEIYFRL